MYCPYFESNQTYHLKYDKLLKNPPWRYMALNIQFQLIKALYYNTNSAICADVLIAEMRSYFIKLNFVVFYQNKMYF